MWTLKTHYWDQLQAFSSGSLLLKGETVGKPIRPDPI